MENNELFKTIEQLKETLTEVSSARQQVSDTVSAYAQIQAEIRSYTENLIGMENALSGLIALLQNQKADIEEQSESAVSKIRTSCDGILEQMKAELSATSQKFAENTATHTNAIDRQIGKLSHMTENISQIADEVKTISAETLKLVSQTTALQKDLAYAQNSIKSYYNNLHASLDNIQMELEKQQRSIDKGTKLNRYLCAIILILTVIHITLQLIMR